jgi:Flp pilus assembly protein TadD
MDYENGAFARAEDGYRRAVAIDPRSIEALHGHCISLVRLGRCREAVTLCRSCLEISAAPQCQQSLRGALACQP